MFIAALFTIAKIWKELVSIHRWVVKDVVYVYSELLLSHKKEWNCAICDNLDGPRGYYAKWNKSEEDKYCMILLICGI